jgi:hypothetical protein
MAKSLTEKGTELLSKMTLEELTDHYEETRKAIVAKADAQLAECEASTNKLKAVKEQVTKQ